MLHLVPKNGRAVNLIFRASLEPQVGTYLFECLQCALILAPSHSEGAHQNKPLNFVWSLAYFRRPTHTTLYGI